MFLCAANIENCVLNIPSHQPRRNAVWTQIVGADGNPAQVAGSQMVVLNKEQFTPLVEGARAR